jgi:hypothetical protein
MHLQVLVNQQDDIAAEPATQSPACVFRPEQPMRGEQPQSTRFLPFDPFSSLLIVIG